MRATVLDGFGSPDALHFEGSPEPQLRTDQKAGRMHTGGVSGYDVLAKDMLDEKAGVKVAGCARFATPFVALPSGGRLVLVSNTPAQPAEPNLSALITRSLSVRRSGDASKPGLEEMVSLVTKGAVHSKVIDVRLLDEAVDYINTVQVKEVIGRAALRADCRS